MFWDSLYQSMFVPRKTRCPNCDNWHKYYEGWGRDKGDWWVYCDKLPATHTIILGAGKPIVYGEGASHSFVQHKN